MPLQPRGAAGARPAPQGRASRLRNVAARIDRRHARRERAWRHRRRWRPICGATCSRISAPRIISTASRMPTANSISRPTGRMFPLGNAGLMGAWDQMPSLPDHWTIIEEADEAHPFRLATSPSRSFLNTTFNETPSSQAREGAPSVMMHPDDAASLGIADGDAVTLGNMRGETTLTAKTVRRRAPRRADRGIGASEQGPYRRPRHQHAHRRRIRRAVRRRGIPRQQGLGEEGRAGGDSDTLSFCAAVWRKAGSHAGLSCSKSSLRGANATKQSILCGAMDCFARPQ